MCAKSVFERIKKQNGERFAKQIRDCDCGIFEVPGVVDVVKFAGRDAMPVMKYLQQLKPTPAIQTDVNSDLTPFALLHMAGYRAEYADTLEKQNAIAKYFAPNEGLCTFHDDKRYIRNYIITAVKYDVDSICRSDFPRPDRTDKYATSVITIQVPKSGESIFITNRYNHSVENPDNTYGSNPDNIIAGLSASISKYFNVNFICPASRITSDKYIVVNGKPIKYNYHINDVYFAETCYVRDGVIYELNRDCQVMMGYLVFDLSTREFVAIPGVTDSFTDAFKQEINNCAIRIGGNRKYNGDKNTVLYVDGRPAVKIVNGCIKELCLQNVNNIGNDFLTYDKTIDLIALPNVTEIGARFMQENNMLRVIAFPRVIKIGSGFLLRNTNVFYVSMPSVQTIDGGFLQSNREMTDLSLPSVQHIGYGFLTENRRMATLRLPAIETIEDDFMFANQDLTRLDLPNLRRVGNNFLQTNRGLRQLLVPKLESVGSNFLPRNTEMSSIVMDSVTTIGQNFMMSNVNMNGIWAPKLESLGAGALAMNKNPDVIDILCKFNKTKKKAFWWTMFGRTR